MKRIAILIIAIGFNIVLGQGTASISGRVVDQGSGDPLFGVNISVQGTYWGGSTDTEGYYVITGIASGDYDLQVTYIGYKTYQRTGIVVQAGEELEIDFELEETVLSFGQDIVIIGKRPLFDVAETSSSTRMSKEDIETMVVDDVVDILSNSGGVSTTDNEVHVRGGRLDETLFIIDGVATKDPLTGNSANLYINADAIEEMEILTGGFNAEYGQAMSGVVNVKLKEGRQDLEGSFKLTTDGVPGLNDYGTQRVEFNLGGPSMTESLLKTLGVNPPGDFYFFLNGYGKVSDTNLPKASNLYPHQSLSFPGLLSDQQTQNLLDRLAAKQENDWHAMFKSTWKISQRLQWANSVDISLNINQGYYLGGSSFPYRYIEILDNYNTKTRTSVMLNSILVHTLSPKSFYELKLSRFATEEHSAVRDLHWSDYRERLDLEPNRYVPSSRDGDIEVTYGDEFYDTGMSPEWYNTFSLNDALKGDWTYSITERQILKSGFEANWTSIQVVDINEPWTGTTGMGSDFDMYRARTHHGSFYIQDNITFEAMIVNVGLRYDYWMPGQYLEDAINDSPQVILTQAAIDKFKDESYDLFGRRTKGHLSPRLGISHPVTDNDVLYFYYGHFSQLPTFQYVFAKLSSNSQSAYQIIGNPTLNPKTTVQYEIGVKHRFSEDQVLELKAYWKNMYNYETSQTVSSENPRYAHLSFNMYFNADYARSRGIEAILRARFWRNWYADGHFSYSIATGKSSNPNDNMLVQAGALSEKPLGENYLGWDRPIRAFLNLSYYKPPNDSRAFLGIKDWGASLRVDYETGRRYTSQTLLDDPARNDLPTGQRLGEDGEVYWYGTPNSDTPNNRIAEKPRFTVDTRIYKNWVIGGTHIRLLLEIQNLLDNRIPRRINVFTGEGFEPGDMISYSYIDDPDPRINPARMERPRMAEIGLQVTF
jgi:outer membrane receptor protein involved in Fe transport